MREKYSTAEEPPGRSNRLNGATTPTLTNPVVVAQFVPFGLINGSSAAAGRAPATAVPGAAAPDVADR